VERLVVPRLLWRWALPREKPQVRVGGAPGVRTLNPRIKRAGVYGPGGSGEVRDLGRVPARHRPDCSELQPELQPRARGRCGAPARQVGVCSRVDGEAGGRLRGRACVGRGLLPAAGDGLGWSAAGAQCTPAGARRTPAAQPGRCPLAAWAPCQPDRERAAVRRGAACPVSPAAAVLRGSPGGAAARGWAGDRPGSRCRGSQSALGRGRASGCVRMRRGRPAAPGAPERWTAPSVATATPSGPARHPAARGPLCARSDNYP
jgi:hypothetical protein